MYQRSAENYWEFNACMIFYFFQLTNSTEQEKKDYFTLQSCSQLGKISYGIKVSTYVKILTSFIDKRNVMHSIKNLNSSFYRLKQLFITI